MPTVREVIESVINEVPGSPFAQTVDTVKSGSDADDVRGIATTFMATHRVLQAAAERDLNFVITHEPTFYGHDDDTEWLASSGIYREKQELIDRHGLTIWRCHDYAHSLLPDIIVAGEIEALGWSDLCTPERPVVTFDPPMLFDDLVQHVQTTLGTRRVLASGNIDRPVRVALFIVGAPGGRFQMEMMEQTGADTLIVGETAEWETPSYIADAAAQGRDVKLIVTGHQPSEEAGMLALARMIANRFPGLPIEHLPGDDPLRAR